MAAIAGLRGTGDWGTDERPKSFREYILWRDPNGESPLQALMARMRSEGLSDPEFSWWEEEQNVLRVSVNGTITSGITALVIDSGGLDMVPGDIFMAEETGVDATYSNELIEVTAVTSDTAVTIARGAAGSTPATITDNTFLTKIGNVFAEGTGAPSVTTRNPTKYTNYAQIFKTAYELTRTAKGTKSRTGPALENDKKRKMFDHSVALEMAYLFGKKHETTGSNGKPKRYTGGLLQHLATAAAAGATHCVKIWGVSPTEDTWLDAVYPVFDYRTGGSGSGNERIALAGNGALNVLNKMARNSTSTRINFDGTVKTYGMELQRWILPQGTIYVRTHPLMNVHPQFKNGMFLINPGVIMDRPFMKTKPEDNIQANDMDTHKGQWITEAGPEFHHLKTMSYQGNMAV